MGGILVPLAFFAFLAAIIIAPFWLRSRERERFYAAVQAACESHAGAPPELLASFLAQAPPEPPLPAPERDLRRGVLMLAAGLGLIGLGAVLWYGLMSVDDLSAWENGGWVGGAGVIVALIGLVHLGFWLARRGRGTQRRS